MFSYHTATDSNTTTASHRSFVEQFSMVPFRILLNCAAYFATFDQKIRKRP